ncbi:carboxylesterase/lipase family protein [Kitasatospora sp. RG8]|uniref:carboxylesterase/lipase family protein n=1 Tax=Kitasatospora sp. RG8 TaxID=2820815 RepID=UPI001AE02FC1|nr:carboxylesterase family protein [Kitasatospora sp. RG8]MBP0448018.1 carboxylesterase/lipase family protein [Kitasatospora sp. RG8]
MPPLVETGYGPVSGTTENGVTRFLGIPYAAAPGSEANRFGPPAPPEPWDQVLEATAYGPTPPKPPIKGQLGELMPDPVIEGDDWLSVNVWTPEGEGRDPLPVMVWIHGGGFTTGSSAVTAYDGATFARDGVVCVTLNYRLGVEGFAYIEGAPAPANRGLLDQVFALEWVRDNIANFGGDPDNVTLFGESAGAMSVLALMSAGVDLFHKAIVQSGTAHLGQTVGDASLVVRAVADRLGVTPDFAGLSTVAPGDLIEAQSQVGDDVAAGADAAKYGESTIAACGMAFMPVIDGGLLSATPFEAIARGAGGNIPLLIGTTTEEFRLFVIPTPMVYWPDAEAFRARAEVYGVPAGFYDQYAKGGTDVYPRRAPSGIACAVLTDRLVRIPTYRIAEARESGGGAAPTYVFEFGWRSPTEPNTLRVSLGACHSLEIPFVWDTLANPESRKFTGPNPPQELAAELHSRWVEFARTGRLAGWAAYDTGDRPVMTFHRDNAPRNEVVNDPRGAERKLWEGVLDPA